MLTFCRITYFRSFDEFKEYVATLDSIQKVQFLHELEENYPEYVSSSYRETFQSFNIQLLSEQPTEVATRIHYIFQTYLETIE
ncbi:MAG: hypothetical protein ACRCXZ_07265 [Patescibacteria group bacterium]